MALENMSDETIKKAVALFYDGESAPTILAKGQHQQAEEILALANEHNIPLCDNAALVDLLSELELGDEIPKTLYISVAHIIAFAFRINLSSNEKL